MPNEVVRKFAVPSILKIWYVFLARMARKFAIPINLYQRLIGGGGWARTNDQAVMSRLL
jgi:hypothetical protein